MKVKFRKVTNEELEAVMSQVTNPAEKIAYYKKRLADTDYQAIKYAEGEISAEEYAPIKAKRAEWRAEINKLEA